MKGCKSETYFIQQKDLLYIKILKNFVRWLLFLR
jgi:hypothetical protein